jgi:hypothetical protein
MIGIQEWAKTRIQEERTMNLIMEDIYAAKLRRLWLDEERWKIESALFKLWEEKNNLENRLRDLKETEESIDG